MGHLEGSGKSAHTVDNYRTDLRVFQRFLEKGLGSDAVALKDLRPQDLDRFHSYMKARGLKTNTRRRKVLTVRKLMRYLSQRKKIDMDVGFKIPAPAKVERVPQTFDRNDLIKRIEKLTLDASSEQNLQAVRNQTLLWMLAETGCLVSEVTRIRFDEIESGQVTLGGAKESRQLPLSPELVARVRRLKQLSGDSQWLFLGFNRAGPMGSPITARGVELLVKALGPKLGLEIHPKHFRHSAVLYWLQSGLSADAVMKLLGLRTHYAFRVFAPLLKQGASQDTSSAKT